MSAAKLEALRDELLAAIAGGAGSAMDPNGDEGSSIDPNGRKG
jgi:hypothetical protein